QSPAGVCGAADGALLFGPAQSVEAERWPMFVGIAAGVHLVFEAEETEVAALMGAESGDFDVVANEVGIAGEFVDLASEELLLVIEAWAPGEIAADFQIFAGALAHHVG